MKKAYGNREGLCFVSNRHPSIKNAIEHVYLGDYHGICSYHLLQNLKSYYGKSGENITQAFNSTIRAYMLEEYDYNMSLLITMNEKIISYLTDVGPEKWSRIHMPTNRYSTMTSNIVESVNVVTKAAKNYPIGSLLESLRQTIQSWFCRHRNDARGTFTKLSSKYEKGNRKMSMDLRNLRVSPSIQTVFSVSNERSTFVVNIEQRTCTCRILQVDLLLYLHALTVIANTRRDPYNYCYYYYTRDA
ncbi:uncharacterized protein LOC111376892 [Olea europaea var. sylvestris]|uniref:uncharacterized protein LOC111376892 n=1 Tax=Olea europaea var. sylvestris TaxID=158386 RepID=UPI000C1D152A|nr:uncharacterized protein LOC111376892 [Olea europaea var. sylvestris]